MDIFLVGFRNREEVQSINQFKNRYEFSDLVWVVAPPERTTCGDIANLLVEGGAGVVFVSKLTDYNGWAEKSLWEKISLWETS